MASASDSGQLSPRLAGWVGDEVVKEFVEAERLTRQSSHDPPEQPYVSLYAARRLLTALHEKLKSCPVVEEGSEEDIAVLCAALLLSLGLNYLSTEEMSRGEECVGECLREVEGLPGKVKTAAVSVEAYNQLGILWGNWGEQQKALESLLKAKAVYESHIALPPPITPTQWLAGREESEETREKEFEGLHTHTLFYLAQVFGHLDQPRQSALYCQQTLCRQMETKEYDPLEWSVSCATLSQYHINTGGYRQARHCLAAASHVLVRCEGRERDGVREKLVQAEGDVARCWTKYCTSLLQASRDRLEGPGSANEAKPSQKLFRFESLEVADLESEVTEELVDSCEAARAVFLFGQRQVEDSKRFYTLEEMASGYVEVVQDLSLLYKLLASFEPEVAYKCRLHKRRLDILSGTLSELNQQHYLSACRQLTFELAEAHCELANLKIVQASEAPSPQAIGKINRYINASITHFQKFVDSFRDVSSGELPSDLAPEVLRPILSAQLACGRLYSQIITPSNTQQVSLPTYCYIQVSAVSQQKLFTSLQFCKRCSLAISRYITEMCSTIIWHHTVTALLSTVIYFSVTVG